MASEKGSGVGRQGLWHRALCMLVILAGLVGACSGDDSAPAATPGPAQGGGGTGSGGGGGGGGGGEGGATGTLVLPAAGGTVEDAATGVVIVVPEGALAADLPITIGLAADASAAAPIPDFELDGTGPMVELLPDGTKFAKPILVGVPMTLDAPAGWPTAAYTLEGGKWARAALLDGSPTLSFYVPASGRAFFATDHFSKWTPGKQFDIFFHPWGAPDYLFVPACDFQESWAGLSGLRKWVEDDVKRRILYREVLLDVATHSRRARTEIEQAKSAGLQKAAAGLKSAATTNKIGALITKLGQIAAQAHPEAFSPAATQALDHGAALMGTLGSAVGVTNAALKCVNEHLATGAIAQRIDMGQANAVEIQADWTKTGFYNYVLQFLADIGKDNAALTQALKDQAELWGARVDAIAGALPGACDKLPGDADASVRLLCQGDGACGVAFGSEACDVCMVQACCEQSAACALDAACKKKCLVGEAPVLPECGDLAKCQTASCAQACGVCVGGTTKCGNKCVDTQTDAANCGACGVACAPGEICSAGKCEIKYAGKHLWSKGFGGADYDHGHSVAVDGSGNAFVTGLFGDEVPQLGTLPPGSHLWPVPAATTRDLATRVALVAGTGGHK